jgi:hypothetical protein
VRNPEGRRLFERYSRRWKGNIKRGVKEMGQEGVNSTNLA